MSNSPCVDVAAARMLSTLQKELSDQGIQFKLTEAHSHVRDLLRAEGLEERVGYFGRYMSVEQAISEFAADSAGGRGSISNPDQPPSQPASVTRNDSSTVTIK